MKCLLLQSDKGTGKTTFAHWLAEAMNVPVYNTTFKDLTRAHPNLIEQGLLLIDNVERVTPDDLKVLEQLPHIPLFVVTTFGSVPTHLPEFVRLVHLSR